MFFYEDDIAENKHLTRRGVGMENILFRGAGNRIEGETEIGGEESEDMIICFLYTFY
jgi:hypothetical protein